ncbi:MAG: precorrin-3B C(17)-methyltransferase [Pseudomonadota bacterium]|nr:precorrin-3B C(17)-methyltransferase [Pseudomonadota bacterium]
MMNQGRIFAVGIGPGGLDLLAPRAREVLERVDVVVGYRPYLDLLGDLIVNKEVVSTGMRGEVARCQSAIAKARQGSMVAVVSSGDAGIYGMAGLLLELEENEETPLIVEVVPGITAANAAAAALGAPLMNDFAVLSLSDWLTPLEEVKRRVKAVAAADLVCVLYNPQSRSRRELLPEVINEFVVARGESTVVGTVRNAGREGGECWIGNISELPVAEVDMVTVVLIGNSRTAIINNRMVTRRGYKVDEA